MKRIILTMKRISILLVLISCTTFTLAQQPNITVKKMINDTYQDIGTNEHILAGQKDTFQIKISEPDDGGEGFFSHSGRLKVFVPDEGIWAGDALQFGNNHEDPSAGNDLTFEVSNDFPDITLSSDSISTTNGDTIYTDVEVDNTPNKQDELVIENLIIEFPDDLSDEDQFVLEAWADFMDTEDGDITMDLVTFEYQR